MKDRQFNGPGPSSILGRLGVVNISFRRPVPKNLCSLPFAYAQQPDWATSEPKIMRSLQQPPKRTTAKLTR